LVGREHAARDTFDELGLKFDESIPIEDERLVRQKWMLMRL
jgi:hypothetical protein